MARGGGLRATKGGMFAGQLEDPTLENLISRWGSTILKTKKKMCLMVRSPRCPMNIPPFVALRPPPRATWTNVRSCYPWEAPSPQPTKHKKNFGNINWVFLSRGEVPKWSPIEAARGPTRGRHGTEKGWPLGGKKVDSREKREEGREK